MPISRRNLFAASAGLAMATAIGDIRTANASTELATVQMPGVIRRKVGTIEVTALLDGYMEMPAALFKAPEDEAARLAWKQFQPASPRLSPVNAFLINLGERLVLVDTGAAGLFGPTLGRTPQALAAAGSSQSRSTRCCSRTCILIMSVVPSIPMATPSSRMRK